MYDKVKKDRRDYPRQKVDIDAILYVGTQNNNPSLDPMEDLTLEISCRVVDISETGICFCIAVEDLQTIKLTSVKDLPFQFIDSYLLDNNKEEAIVSGFARVVYTTQKGSDFFVGCYVSSVQYSKYVTHRKFVEFYKEIKERERKQYMRG